MDISIHGVVDSGHSGGIIDSSQLRSMTVQAMERMHQHLGLLDWVDSNMLIDKASVPVIKLIINLNKLDKLRDPEERVFSIVDNKNLQ